VSTTSAVLLDLLAAAVPAGGRAWVAALTDAGAPARFTSDFAAATRRAGSGPLALDAGGVACLRGVGLDWPVDEWTMDDLARVAMLVNAAERLAPDAFAALVADCHAHGDLEERRAVLRALPLLPDAGRFVALAVDACRTNVRSLFEAIACDNPFPAAHFPEPAFNQMVLKTVFQGVPLARLVGLGARSGAELRRMARDYARERRAAGRPVSADLRALAGQEDA
jgi:hypothetical protein